MLQGILSAGGLTKQTNRMLGRLIAEEKLWDEAMELARSDEAQVAFRSAWALEWAYTMDAHPIEARFRRFFEDFLRSDNTSVQRIYSKMLCDMVRRGAVATDALQAEELAGKCFDLLTDEKDTGSRQDLADRTAGRPTHPYRMDRGEPHGDGTQPVRKSGMPAGHGRLCTTVPQTCDYRESRRQKKRIGDTPPDRCSQAPDLYRIITQPFGRCRKNAIFAPQKNDPRYEKRGYFSSAWATFAAPPAAEGILRSKAEKAGLAEHYEIDSAGTYSGHSGDLPDPRMREAAQRRGYRLTHRARPVLDEDFPVSTCSLPWTNATTTPSTAWPLPSKTKPKFTV